MDDTAYREWLERHNVSRPHRTGRWRVWWNDTLTVDMPPFVLAVADYESTTPTRADVEYFRRWRESDERRHKQNAAGFLRFSITRRHLVDGSGESQVRRVREMARKIKEAMFLFAQGENAAGTDLMQSAWGEYMMIVVLSKSQLAVKGARFSPGRRKGAKGSFTRLVEDAARAASSKSWETVVQRLESMNHVVDEVDWDDKKIWIAGEDRPRTFKTVMNILSKL